MMHVTFVEENIYSGSLKNLNLWPCTIGTKGILHAYFFFLNLLYGKCTLSITFLGDFWAAFDTKHDPTCCSRLFETIYHWRRQMKYHINNIFALDHYALIIHVEFLAGNLIYKRGWFIHGKGFYIGFGPDLRWKGLLYTFSFTALGLW